MSYKWRIYDTIKPTPSAYPRTCAPVRRWAGAIDRSPAWLVRRILSVALAEYEEAPAGYHIEVSAVADDGGRDSSDPRCKSPDAPSNLIR